MAEICCGVVSGAVETATDVCEPSPRSARRRRMEVRKFRFVSGMDGLTMKADLLSRKRRKLDFLAVLRKDSGEGEAAESRIERGSGAGDAESSSNPSSRLAPAAADRDSGVAASDLSPRYGMTSVCGRRREMEDAVSIRPDFVVNNGSEIRGRYHFYGVFDGHGCSHVAVSCKDRMHEMVAEEMNRQGPSGTDWKEVMEKSFSRMDAEVVASPGGQQNASCRCELQTPKCDHVGSTAVVSVVAEDKIVVANCGDSRAVLCRRGVPVPLSSDHKPDRPDELQRIQDAGGRVIYWDGARVLGVLAMSRAIGDSYLKPFVIAEPEVTVTERTEEDECLILASDGLWDVVTNEMACEIVRMCLRGNGPPAGRGADKACSDAAMLLTKLALARQSSDNVSVVVVDLRRRNNNNNNNNNGDNNNS